MMNETKTLYLMRHGETLFNVENKIQGWCDSPLTVRGIQQGLAAHEFFQSIELDHAYSSTAERASDTLELAIDARLPYQRLKDLREMGFGTFEGESERLNPKSPKEYQSFFVPYGGESSNAVGERMLKTLTGIMSLEDRHVVLAVSHAGACFNFLRMLQDPTEELAKGFTNGMIFKYQFTAQQFHLEEVIRPQI